MASSSRFDRAALLRTQLPELEARLNDDRSWVLPMWRDQTLVRAAGRELGLLPMQAGRALLEERFELVFLGLLDEQAVFAIDMSDAPEPLRHPAISSDQQRAELADLRLIGALLNEDEVGIAAYARGILSWHRRHGFCSACGSPTTPRRGGHVRMCRNEACAIEHFPRTDPAIIVLVQDRAGEHCLLGRQRGWPAGLYSTLAGFVEPGETLEQAVAREVAEESGVLVHDARYVGSQPWPFPASLMLGFMATALTSEIQVDGEELEDARWVSRTALAAPEPHGLVIPPPYSLASKLIARFMAGSPGSDSPAPDRSNG